MNFFKKIARDEDSGAPARKMTIQDVSDNMPLLEQAEKTVSEFYLLCSDAFPEKKDFWLSMAASELRHAENIRKMSALIEKEPRKYRAGYPFHPAAIRAFVFYLENLLEKMRNGEIPGEQALSVAAEIEDSAVELHYGEIVETGVEEFKILAHEIDDETAEHKRSLDLIIGESEGR